MTCQPFTRRLNVLLDDTSFHGMTCHFIHAKQRRVKGKKRTTTFHIGASKSFIAATHPICSFIERQLARIPAIPTYLCSLFTKYIQYLTIKQVQLTFVEVELEFESKRKLITLEDNKSRIGLLGMFIYDTCFLQCIYYLINRCKNL